MAQLLDAEPGLRLERVRIDGYAGCSDFRGSLEAHADGGSESQWQSTINQKEGIELPAPRSLGEKQEHAALCVRKLSLPFAIEVDGMDAAAEKAYQAWPSRLYIIGRDGKVAFQTRLGELDFHPSDFERAIHEILAGRDTHAHER